MTATNARAAAQQVVDALNARYGINPDDEWQPFRVLDDSEVDPTYEPLAVVDVEAAMDWVPCGFGAGVMLNGCACNSNRNGTDVGDLGDFWLETLNTYQLGVYRR